MYEIANRCVTYCVTLRADVLLCYDCTHLLFFSLFLLGEGELKYTGCPIKNGTVDFQYIASRKLSIFLRHCIKYLPQKRMIPKSFNLVG